MVCHKLGTTGRPPPRSDVNFQSALMIYMSDGKPLTDLIKQGRAETTARAYAHHLKRLYRGVQDLKGCDTPDFEDPSWLGDHDTVVKALEAVQPHTVVSHTVTAVRGTLKPIPDLYRLYNKESDDLITEHSLSQNFTQKDLDKWVSLKELKQHMKTFEPALAEMQKERRACKAQSGFPGKPFVPTVAQRKVITKHLVLSLYANQPPVRLDMADMPIYEGDVPEEHADNYLHCPDPRVRPFPKYTAVMSKYKTSKFLGTRTREFPPAVCRHVFFSLQLWPRSYLLALLNDGDRPLGRPYLTKVFADIYPGKSLGASLIRKIYVSDKLKNQMPEEERRKLAEQMLHSVIS